MNKEKLVAIEEIQDLKLSNLDKFSKKARPGVTQAFDTALIYAAYDGYKITTSEQEYLILIHNGRCCCERWGYFASEDDFSNYIGKTLLGVSLTDKALNTKKVEESKYYDDCGGIQFVDFRFTDGSVLQFAVYNAHNGYYGHPIIIAKDRKILLKKTL
jgi:hypothetical protein